MLISSPSNPKVAYLASLHDAKGRAKARALLVEGLRVVTMALDCGVMPRLLLYQPELLERSPAGRVLVARLLDLARRGDGELLAVTERVLARASDTQTPAGVVAAVPWDAVAADTVWARRMSGAKRQSPPLVLLLDGLADPGNLGTILRSALAADVDEVWLTPGSADVYGPKVVRAASGAHFLLPLRPNYSWETCAATLASLAAQHPPSSPEAEDGMQVLLAEARGPRAYSTYDLNQPTCLIIGNEAHGPSAAARRLATATLTIPMSNGVESLNAAIAASVILFETRRHREAVRLQRMLTNRRWPGRERQRPADG